jgi:hypothetical protein
MPIVLNSQADETDSIKAIIARDKGFCYGIELGYQIDRVSSIRFKPCYYKSGFLLSRYDLQLFDQVHPVLGEIRDQAQASSKNVYFHHRFKNIGLETEYTRLLGSNTSNRPLKFAALVGLGLYYLVSQDLMVVTEGFAIDDAFKHQIKDSLFFVGNSLMGNAFFGGEMNFITETQLQVYAQAKFRSSLNRLTSNEPGIFIWSTCLQVGIRKLF